MSARQTILVIDDEPDIRKLVKEILEDEGFLVQVAAEGERARELFAREKPQLVLLDICMPKLDGISLLKEWKTQQHSAVPVVMMSDHGTVETAVEATRFGAYDFIEKPLAHAKLLLTVRHALLESRLRTENIGLRESKADRHESIVGTSRVIQSLRDKLERIARHDTPVLISGPSGTNKGSCARHIHGLGTRNQAPFLAVNVTGIDRASAGQLLFGDANTLPCLEHARGGTLFIKDIAELDPGTQTDLYRAIEAGTFRVGGTGPQTALDVRIVAGTRARLSQLVQEGKFRDDLYYQLSVLEVNVPTLIEHREDIPELLDYYVNYLVEAEGLSFRHFTVAAKNHLRIHDWPGNLRELKNLVQRLLLLGSGENIHVDEIKMMLNNYPPSDGGAPRKSASLAEFELPMREAREKFERAYLVFHLAKHDGNIERTAGAVGIHRTHLYRKLKNLGITLK